MLETRGGISSKDYSSTKTLLQDGSYFSPTHLSSFQSTEEEKSAQELSSPFCEVWPKAAQRSKKARHTILGLTSNPTIQDASSSERHYFRMSYSAHFFWYISWGLLSINGHWIKDVVQYISVYSPFFFFNGPLAHLFFHSAFKAIDTEAIIPLTLLQQLLVD